MILILGSIFLFFISLIIGKRIGKQKKQYGLDNGKIIYSDIFQNERSLFSDKLNLSGKPDYLVKTKKGIIIPVEVKTGVHEDPLKHHVMQLIAYCQLVEDTTGQKVPYGLLFYYDTGKRFKIPFDRIHRSELHQTIREMRSSLETGFVERNHKEPSKCIHCSMRRYCKKHLD
jgi:CRISPR-associated exonuclease Cas4